MGGGEQLALVVCDEQVVLLGGEGEVERRGEVLVRGAVGLGIARPSSLSLWSERMKRMNWTLPRSGQPEYQQIKEDYESLSLKYFSKRYVRAPDLSFARSAGLFPGESLRARIIADYDEQCRTLCYGAYPSFDDVVGRFERLRELL